MKVFRYFYNCKSCSANYIEQRNESDNQFILNCICGGKFEETDKEFLEEIIIPEPTVDEVIDETLAE